MGKNNDPLNIDDNRPELSINDDLFKELQSLTSRDNVMAKNKPVLNPTQIKQQTGGVGLDRVMEGIGEVNIFNDDIQDRLGEEQSAPDKWANFGVQVAAEIFGGTVEGTGYLGDVQGTAAIIDGDMDQFGNWLSDIGVGMKEGSREHFPIFGAHDAGNLGFWLSNGVSVASSLSLMIPAVGAIRGVGMLGKAVGIGAKLGKGAKYAQLGKGMTVLGQAFTSRHMENMMEASGVWEQTRQASFEAGKDVEEANLIASKAASELYKVNYALLGQDILQYALLAKGPKINADITSRRLASALGQSANKATMKNVYAQALTMGSEGIEEGLQFIFAEEAKYSALHEARILDKEKLSDRLSSYVDNGEMWTNVLFGALGAGVMQGGRNLTKKYTKSGKAEQAQLEARIEHAQNLYKNTTAAAMKLQAATQSGNKEAIKAAENEILFNSTYSSAELGLFDAHMASIDDLIASDQDKAEAEPTNFSPDFKERLTAMKGDMKTIGKLYEQNAKKYSPGTVRAITHLQYANKKLNESLPEIQAREFEEKSNFPLYSKLSAQGTQLFEAQTERLGLEQAIKTQLNYASAPKTSGKKKTDIEKMRALLRAEKFQKKLDAVNKKIKNLETAEQKEIAEEAKDPNNPGTVAARVESDKQILGGLTQNTDQVTKAIAERLWTEESIKENNTDLEQATSSEGQIKYNKYESEEIARIKKEKKDAENLKKEEQERLKKVAKEEALAGSVEIKAAEAEKNKQKKKKQEGFNQDQIDEDLALEAAQDESPSLIKNWSDDKIRAFIKEAKNQQTKDILQRTLDERQQKRQEKKSKKLDNSVAAGAELVNSVATGKVEVADNDDLFENNDKKVKNANNSPLIAETGHAVAWKTTTGLTIVELAEDIGDKDKSNAIALSEFLEDPSIDKTKFRLEFFIDKNSLRNSENFEEGQQEELKVLYNKFKNKEDISDEEIGVLPVRAYIINEKGERLKSTKGVEITAAIHDTTFSRWDNLSKNQKERAISETIELKKRILSASMENKQATSDITEVRNGHIMNEDKGNKLAKNNISTVTGIDPSKIKVVMGDAAPKGASSRYVSKPNNKIEEVEELDGFSSATPGAVYVIVKTANGSSFPLRTFIETLTEQEANLVYELYKKTFEDPNAYKENLGKPQHADLRNLIKNSDDPRVSELANFLDINNKLTIQDLLKVLVYEGMQTKGTSGRLISNPTTISIVGTSMDKDTFLSEEGKKVAIENLLLKRRQANIDLISNPKYVSYLINNEIITTTATSVNGVMFRHPTTVFGPVEIGKVKAEESKKEEPTTDTTTEKRGIEDNKVVAKEEEWTITNEEGGKIVVKTQTMIDGSFKGESIQYDAEGNVVDGSFQAGITFGDSDILKRDGTTAEQAVKRIFVSEDFGDVIEKTGEKAGSEVMREKKISRLTEEQKTKAGISTTTATTTDIEAKKAAIRKRREEEVLREAPKRKGNTISINEIKSRQLKEKFDNDEYKNLSGYLAKLPKGVVMEGTPMFNELVALGVKPSSNGINNSDVVSKLKEIENKVFAQTRADIKKEGLKVISNDARKAADKEFFDSLDAKYGAELAALETTTGTTTEAITEDEVTAMAVPRTFFADRIARIKEVISGKRRAAFSGKPGNYIASPMDDAFNEKDSNDRFISSGGSDVYLTQEENSEIALIKMQRKIGKINGIESEAAIQKVLQGAFERALATYEVVEDAPTLGVKERVEAFKSKTTTTTDTTTQTNEVKEVTYKGIKYSVDFGKGAITNLKTGSVLKGGVTSPTGLAIVDQAIAEQEANTTDTTTTYDTAPTPIEGLNERLEGYGFTKLNVSKGWGEGPRPKGRLNGFKSSIMQVQDNLQVLNDLDLSEFDFLSSEDLKRLEELRPKAKRFRKLNMLLSDNKSRTVATEKEYAKLSNEILNEFVDVIGPHVEKQLGKSISTNKPLQATTDTSTKSTQERIEESNPDLTYEQYIERQEKESERFLKDKDTREITLTAYMEELSKDPDASKADIETLKFISKFWNGNINYHEDFTYDLPHPNINPGERWGGTFNSGSNSVFIFDKESLTTETVIHEALHAMVQTKLEKYEGYEKDFNPVFAKEITRLFEYTKQYLNKDEHYGLNDIHEFVSEAFGNPQFREELGRLQDVNRPKNNVFSSFIQAIKDFFISENNQDIGTSVLESILKSTNIAIDPASTTPATTTDTTTGENPGKVLADSENFKSNGKETTYSNTTKEEDLAEEGDLASLMGEFNAQEGEIVTGKGPVADVERLVINDGAKTDRKVEGKNDINQGGQGAMGVQTLEDIMKLKGKVNNPKPTSSTEVKLESTDRVVFGHPLIGKSFLKKNNDNRFLSLDDDSKYLNQIEKGRKRILDKYSKESLTKYDKQNSAGNESWHREYKALMQRVYEVAKKDAISSGKTLMLSNTEILKNNLKDFDKIINIESQTFLDRVKKTRPEAKYDTQSWKSGIDGVIKNADKSKIINTKGYLSELLPASAKPAQYPAGIASTIYENNPDLTDENIKTLYNNYRDLMNRQREGKSVSLEKFKNLLKSYQVFNYKDTYIFGTYDQKTATFVTRMNSSPSARQLLVEAIPALGNYGVDVISLVPKDYADKLERSGYTVTKQGYRYNFKGEEMRKYAAVSNPSVLAKLFNKDVNTVTSRDIEKFSDGLTLGYTAVEIDAKSVKDAGNNLTATLETYLNNFGIAVKDISEMEKALDVDSAGVADILSKIAFVRDVESLPEVAGEFIAHMMQYNPLVKEIIREMPKVKNYETLTKKERVALKNKQLKQIGNLISNQIKNKPTAKKSLREKIISLLERFMNLLTKTNIGKINANVGQIVNNVLQQNKKLITASKFKPGEFGKPVSQVSIDAAMAKDKFGASIIDVLSKSGFLLTGSTALSEQGTVLRPKENPLHDIDWVSPFSRQETKDKFLKIYPEAQKIREIINEDYFTDTYLIMPEGHKLQNYKTVTFTDTKGEEKVLIDSYEVTKNGKVVGTYNLSKDEDGNNKEDVTGVEGKAIDFFIYENFTEALEYPGLTKTTQKGKTLGLSNWKNIFKAKLEYSRYKDIWDYNRFVPNENVSLFRSVTGGFENKKGVTTITNKPKPTKPNTGNITQKEIDEVANMVPESVSTEVVKDYIKLLDGGQAVVGAFQAGLVQISKKARAGDGYHEAFHAVFRTMLSKEEQQEILQEARDMFTPLESDVIKLMSQHKISKDKATDLYYEEQLADEFAVYAANERAYDFNKKKGRENYFARLMSWSKDISGVTGNMEKIFKNLKQGNFNKANNVDLLIESGLVKSINDKTGKPC